MITIEREKIKTYIYNKRMVSVKNLCEHFCLSYSEMNEIINQMIEEKKVRTSHGQSACSGNCGSCSNEGENHQGLESMIVISLNRNSLME